MSEDRYLSRKEVAKSYRPRSYVMSPGLLRARAPFRLQNALTGVILAGFATAVWAYSIRAVKQDDFSDVDEEAREMTKGKETQSGDVLLSSSSSSSATATVGVGVDVIGAGVSHAQTSTTVHPPSRIPRGVLAPVLDRAFPNLLDPTRKTLVWGAPPVNDVGRVGLRALDAEGR